MTAPPKIRKADPSESEYLSNLALHSKAYWGYSNDFLESCREELTVEPTRMGDDRYQCFVAEQDGKILGFYAVNAISKDAHELEALFVEPDHIGRGVGQRLLQHAVRLLSTLGANRMTIQGDPNSTRFYLAAGAVQIGERESGSIPGRFLPLFEIDLANL